MLNKVVIYQNCNILLTKKIIVIKQMICILCKKHVQKRYRNRTSANSDVLLLPSASQRVCHAQLQRMASLNVLEVFESCKSHCNRPSCNSFIVIITVRTFPSALKRVFFSLVVVKQLNDRNCICN